MRRLENRGLERVGRHQGILEGERPVNGQTLLARARCIDHPAYRGERVFHSVPCEKCGHTICELTRVCMLDNPFNRLSELREHTYIAVSCTDCGHTEFYSAAALEDGGQAQLLLEELLD